MKTQELLFTVAATLFGLALVLYVANATNRLPSLNLFAQQQQSDTSLTRSSKAQHLYGDPDAPIKVVEFSDFSCGFCGRLHPTLKQIVDDSDGQIVWEYRHFPILRELSSDAALASECVAKLSNVPNSFWRYAEVIFANQRSLSTDFLLSEAINFGVNEAEFNTCVNDQDIITQVETDAAVARSLGARGTPYSVIIYPDGRTIPVSGAVPEEEWNRLFSSS